VKAGPREVIHEVECAEAAEEGSDEHAEEPAATTEHEGEPASITSQVS
jgi:hypothetical protein